MIERIVGRVYKWIDPLGDLRRELIAEGIEGKKRIQEAEKLRTKAKSYMDRSLFPELFDILRQDSPTADPSVGEYLEGVTGEFNDNRTVYWYDLPITARERFIFATKQAVELVDLDRPHDHDVERVQFRICAETTPNGDLIVMGAETSSFRKEEWVGNINLQRKLAWELYAHPHTEVQLALAQYVPYPTPVLVK